MDDGAVLDEVEDHLPGLVRVGRTDDRDAVVLQRIDHPIDAGRAGRGVEVSHGRRGDGRVRVGHHLGAFPGRGPVIYLQLQVPYTGLIAHASTNRARRG